jgi:catalase
VRVAAVTAKSAAQDTIAHHDFLVRSENFRRSLESMTPPNQSNWHRFLSDRGIPRSTGMTGRYGSHPYVLSEETPSLP